jgi:hypothetical protein
MSGIQATRLRFGFLDQTTQFFHISNIKIINSYGEDIMLKTGTKVTPTSTYVGQSPGDLKTILTDNDPNTFSHSELKSTQYIKVDFDKPHTIVQIIMNNRPTSSDRIINVQFRLSNDAISNDQTVYESDKITVDSPYYYLSPPNKTIYTGTEPARKLRIGFFDKDKKQFLHLNSIRIINKDNLDIAMQSTFTQTSTWPGYENDLKKVLTDQDNKTFNHTSDAPNQYLTIDFGKNEQIQYIVIQNRDDQPDPDVKSKLYDRLIDAQVKLYDEFDNLIFVSNKVTTGMKLYVIQLPSPEFLSSMMVNIILPIIETAIATTNAKKQVEAASSSTTSSSPTTSSTTSSSPTTSSTTSSSPTTSSTNSSSPTTSSTTSSSPTTSSTTSSSPTSSSENTIGLGVIGLIIGLILFVIILIVLFLYRKQIRQWFFK